MSNDTFGYRESDWENNACIGYSQADMIAEGFRDTANLLAYRTQDDNAFLDSLVYPIAFNFRHAIELKLKSALLLASLISRAPKQPPTHHKLDQLWIQLKPYVKARFASDPDYPRIVEIEEILADFVSIDPTSMSFRYATDTKGNAMLSDLANVNVALLQERANLLYSLLDTIDGVFAGDWSGCTEPSRAPKDGSRDFTNGNSTVRPC